MSGRRSPQPGGTSTFGARSSRSYRVQPLSQRRPVARSAVSTLQADVVFAPSQARSKDQKFESLCLWVTENGGHVHPALDMGITPTASRAVVALEDITAEEQARNGCILSVPECLQLNSGVAKSVLQHTFLSLGYEDIVKELPFGEKQLLAYFVAFENTKGSNSFWAPYIDCLPDEHQCGYLMDPSVVSHCLKGYSQSTEYLTEQDIPSWQQRLDSCATTVRTALQEHGRVLEALNLSVAEVEWAFGQVTSRSFSSAGNKVIMLPLIDCLNHSSNAHQLWKWSATGRLQFGTMHRATKTAGNQPETLIAGSELLIDYGMHYHVWNAEESHTPFQPPTANALVPGFQAFSRWGFIPDH